MRVHLLDGTYELFRHYFAVPRRRTAAGQEVGAVRGVLASVIGMLSADVTHLGVATDHVIESFRNAMWPGYKTSEGIEPDLLAQFHPLEDALRALGVVVFAMTDLEADDALASAAAIAARDPRVEQVLICTPDKDLSQCVSEKHVVQFDRRRREMRDERGVVERFGVRPSSIPDYLALIGDSADGFPGLQGWGPKSAATVLARFDHIENIPEHNADWNLPLRGAGRLAKTLADNKKLALLFRDLATLRADAALFENVHDLRWTGPTEGFAELCRVIDAQDLAERVSALRPSSGSAAERRDVVHNGQVEEEG
jgi:5'-3' exonuclease